MDVHTLSTHCRGMLSLKLLSILADKPGTCDRRYRPCPVMYITALGHVFFYACNVHTRQAAGTGGCASHAMPEEEMPFATAKRRCRAIARR